MTNKLKQIEQAIECEQESLELLKVACKLKGLELDGSETLKLEALSLLKEVEEGKAHVMRWRSLEKGEHNFGHNVMLTQGNHFCEVAKFAAENWDTHVATFNNNNGEIPMPKEGE